MQEEGTIGNQGISSLEAKRVSGYSTSIARLTFLHSSETREAVSFSDRNTSKSITGRVSERLDMVNIVKPSPVPFKAKHIVRIMDIWAQAPILLQTHFSLHWKM